MDRTTNKRKENAEHSGTGAKGSCFVRLAMYRQAGGQSYAILRQIPRDQGLECNYRGFRTIHIIEWAAL